MKRLFVALMTCLAFALVVFLPTIRPVEAASGQSVAAPEDAQPENVVVEAAYCVSKGGEVVTRKPYYNTNAGEPDWFALSGERQFCKFTSKADGSRIHVLLSTLYTDKPSLAALAYYAKVKMGTCEGNPASCYCSLLGGTDLFGGINLNGGGWVDKADPIDTVLEACILPDMSSIDSWGLAYHSAGIVRGKNLSEVLRYKNPYGKK
ncbi:MAG: hypothetical protein WAU58_01895 [Terriglobales bacterium]